MTSLAYKVASSQNFESSPGFGDNGNSTPSLSTTQHHGGTTSLKVVANLATSGISTWFDGGGGPIGSLQWVTISGWIFTSVSGITANLSVDFKDSGFGYLSGLYPSAVSIPTNTWTFFTASGQTVSGTANWTPTANFNSVSIGDAVYFDDVALSAGVPVLQSRSSVPAQRASLV